MARFGLLRSARRLALLLILAAAGIASMPEWQIIIPAHADEADTRKKSALIIGMNRYRNASALANPAGDAALLARRLAVAGFSVRQIADVDLPEFKAAVAAFLDAAKGADIALVYYAGHAVQIDGQNFLVPIDFDGSNGDILGQLISVDDLINGMAGAAQAQVLLLDSCRDNPFLTRIDRSLQRSATGRGLAPIQIPVVDAATVESSVRGLMVGYATQPGDVANDGDSGNGPYALALDDVMRANDEDLNTLLVKTSRKVLTATRGQQRPEHRVAVTGPLYLVARKTPLGCDRLAAEEDNNISVPGVAFDQLMTIEAEEACRSDLRQFPDNPRLKHNLARVLDKAGRDAEAVKLYRQAATAGYDWSQNNLGVMLLNGEGTQPDPVEAVIWFRRAFAQGNRQAAVNYADYDVSPLFKDFPRLAGVLQRALFKAGQTEVKVSNVMDQATDDALARFKASKGLRSAGISLQVLDELGIVAEVFRGASR